MTSTPTVTRFEIRPSTGRPDPRGDAVARAAAGAGMSVTRAQSCRVYLVEGTLTPEQIGRVRDGLLRDPVLETATVGVSNAGAGVQVVEVHPLAGVMDPAAHSVKAAVGVLLGGSVGGDANRIEVSTGWRYDLEGISAEQAKTLAEMTLANKVVQGIHHAPWTPAALPKGHASEFKVRTVSIRGKSDEELAVFSREAHLFLSLDEMRAVKAEYDRLGRDPTDVELETLAQTWSEHCVHKTLKSKVKYREVGAASGGADARGGGGAGGEKSRMSFEVSFGKPGSERRVASHDVEDEDGGEESGSGDVIVWEGRPGHVVGSDGTVVIDNLLKRTVAAATFELIEEGIDWTLSVFKDNSGVIAFDENFGVCVKVETHNRPSAIEPYGGAATGAGGCIRDVIGTGLGARPIASTDIFCVAHPDAWRGRTGEGKADGKQLPPGTLHPKRVLTEVVAGVRDYGNRMGIPTVSGGVHFDDRYVGNPLVFCGCIGLIPRGLVHGAVKAGDRIIALGGRTGRDGIHGATFSSAEVEHTHADEFAHAVQIGNAIEEKRVLDAIMRARSGGAGGKPLYTGMTDCGAGGFSSAIGEMAKDVGASVQLEKAPLKYAGLTYTEIWISEAQERMVLSVPAENVEKLRAICAEEGVELADLGVFGTESKTLKLSYNGVAVGEMSMEFLHDGIPQPTREAVWREPTYTATSRTRRGSGNVQQTLLKLLSHPTIASKHWIIRQYDHEVQGNTVVKPLVGPAGRGPGDATVIEPISGSGQGLSVSCGLATGVGDPTVAGDPYLAALAGIDECVRNLVCVGTHPERIAILDNFCWPSCEKPENLAALVRACEGCYDGAKAYGTPFVSGKDSLNNQLRYEDPVTGEKKVIEIPPTLLISGIGIVQSINKCVTMDAKASGNVLMLIGRGGPEMAGSVFESVEGLGGMEEDALRVPRVDLKVGPATADAVATMINDGIVKSAHDCSDGGLLVAVAEMVIAAHKGSVDTKTASAATADVKIDVNSVIQNLLKPSLSSLMEKQSAGVAAASEIGVELSIWDDMLAAEQLAFGEAPSRYVIEIEQKDVQRVRNVLRDFGGIHATLIGTLNTSGKMTWAKGDVSVGVAELVRAWRGTLDW
jgi:phosphoribosylformylglycinamidine synthase II